VDIAPLLDPEFVDRGSTLDPSFPPELAGRRNSFNLYFPPLVPLCCTSITHQTPTYLKDFHCYATTTPSLNTLSNVSLGITYPIENFVLFTT